MKCFQHLKKSSVYNFLKVMVQFFMCVLYYSRLLFSTALFHPQRLRNLWDFRTLCWLGWEKVLAYSVFATAFGTYKPPSSSPPQFLYNKVSGFLLHGTSQHKRLEGSQTKTGFHSPGTRTPWILAGVWAPGPRAESRALHKTSACSCCTPLLWQGSYSLMVAQAFSLLINAFLHK